MIVRIIQLTGWLAIVYMKVEGQPKYDTVEYAEL